MLGNKQRPIDQKQRPSTVPALLIACWLLMMPCRSCAPPTPSGAGEPVFVRDSLRYARNCSIERSEDSLIRLRLYGSGADTQPPIITEYLLYPKGRPSPAPGAIAVPAERIVCTGTVQAAFLDFMGATDRIVAIADDKYLYNPQLLARIKRGEVLPLGNDGQWDMERALSVRPDLVIASGSPTDPLARKWQSLGIPVVSLWEFAEETPLGRAEWALWLACFLGEQAQNQARQAFDQVAADYEALRDSLAARLPSRRPTVLTGTDYEGSWYVAGGKSFVARLIADAGGDYLWADNTETGGLALDFEAVYTRARHADVWLHVLQVPDLPTLRSLNPRYEDFKALHSGRIFNYSRRRSPGGGYDFFESAIVRPDRVLRDLSRIMAGTDTADSLFYYEALPLKAPPTPSLVPEQGG